MPDLSSHSVPFFASLQWRKKNRERSALERNIQNEEKGAGIMMGQITKSSFINDGFFLPVSKLFGLSVALFGVHFNILSEFVSDLNSFSDGENKVRK